MVVMTGLIKCFQLLWCCLWHHKENESYSRCKSRPTGRFVCNKPVFGTVTLNFYIYKHRLQYCILYNRDTLLGTEMQRDYRYFYCWYKLFREYLTIQYELIKPCAKVPGIKNRIIILCNALNGLDAFSLILISRDVEAFLIRHLEILISCSSGCK